MPDAPDAQATAAAEKAAEDQAIAAARLVARCARRFWSALYDDDTDDQPTGAALPEDLAKDLCRVWWDDFICAAEAEDDDD